MATATGMNVQGTITETDSGALSLNAGGIPLRGDDPSIQNYPNWALWGGYKGFLSDWNWWLLEEPNPDSMHLQDMLNAMIADPNGYLKNSAAAADLLAWLQNQGSSLTPPLRDMEVQYTTGYNDQVMAVSGQSTFVKSVAVSTGNRIADQSNIKADTGLQFIAIDTGRATRTEDLLLDGAAQATNTSDAILCPFVNSVSSVIPAYCNIEQAGSSIDTTLTSVVTHADNRFVGTDSTFPVVLNYNINAQGITLSDGTSSPMIGSVSAYLKVHVQEARNASSIPDIVNIGASYPDSVITQPPVKSEDLVYSETSSASGLINKFSKSMSYQSGFNLI
ncbi:MAG TPA: hypothetical protein VMC42_07315 [Methanoregulaceae archaeon]|nr:hypothetical protein [Methanoregulaceae archaeon]